MTTFQVIRPRFASLIASNITTNPFQFQNQTALQVHQAPTHDLFQKQPVRFGADVDYGPQYAYEGGDDGGDGQDPYHNNRSINLPVDKPEVSITYSVDGHQWKWNQEKSEWELTGLYRDAKGKIQNASAPKGVAGETKLEILNIIKEHDKDHNIPIPQTGIRKKLTNSIGASGISKHVDSLKDLGYLTSRGRITTKGQEHLAQEYRQPSNQEALSKQPDGSEIITFFNKHKKIHPNATKKQVQKIMTEMYAQIQEMINRGHNEYDSNVDNDLKVCLAEAKDWDAASQVHTFPDEKKPHSTKTKNSTKTNSAETGTWTEPYQADGEWRQDYTYANNPDETHVYAYDDATAKYSRWLYTYDTFSGKIK